MYNICFCASALQTNLGTLGIQGDAKYPQKLFYQADGKTNNIGNNMIG